jgi:hypothetical protein
MWLSDTSTLVSFADGDDTQFGEDHGAAHGSCDFLGAFHAETDVAITVADDDESLEAGMLTSASLFLHRTDLLSDSDTHTTHTFMTSSLSLGRK